MMTFMKARADTDV